MPCSDNQSWGEPTPKRPTRQEILNSLMPAVLCSLVEMLGPETVIQTVDWKEAGVTPNQFREWWAKHQEIDAARRRLEAEFKHRSESKDKLTPDEWAAVLGKRKT